VAAGDPLITFVDESAGYELVALLPGPHASHLKPGMPLRFKLQGQPDAQQDFVISRVAAGVVGPREAARYAGLEAAPVAGPVVIVRAAPAAPGAAASQDGMTGTAEVVARSEPMIVVLLPGLRQLAGTLR
jgi:hypothetical protein